MKNSILSAIILATIVSVPCMASVSIDKTLTQEYMQNNGYSKQIYDTVNVSRARALGKEYYSDEERAFQNMPKTKRVLWRIYSYFDPAAEDFSFYHHDTTPAPSYNDL